MFQGIGEQMKHLPQGSPYVVPPERMYSVFFCLFLEPNVLRPRVSNVLKCEHARSDTDVATRH